jgi:hypothetical protein
MIVYDGPNIASPRFAGGTNISGTTIPGPFQATNATGTITVRFISGASGNSAGWKANFECLTLATNETTLANDTNISKTAVKGVFVITSKDKIISYQVLDASGKMVKNSNKLNGSEEKLDISNNPAGTYVVNVITTKGAVTKKIVK